MVDAAVGGGDLSSAVSGIVHSLGFETTFFRPGHDSFVYLVTTAPQAWVRLYDQRSYIEIDPRIEAAVTCTLPHVWDQVTERGKSVRVDKFLDDAANYGISSGVSFLDPACFGRQLWHHAHFWVLFSRTLHAQGRRRWNAVRARGRPFDRPRTRVLNTSRQWTNDRRNSRTLGSKTLNCVVSLRLDPNETCSCHPTRSGRSRGASAADQN